VLSQTFDGIPVPQVGGGFLSRPSTFEEWITQIGMASAVSGIKALVNGSLRTTKVYIKGNYKIYLKPWIIIKIIYHKIFIIALLLFSL